MTTFFYRHCLLVAVLSFGASASMSAQSACSVPTPYFADRFFKAYFRTDGELFDQIRTDHNIVWQSPTAPHGAVEDPKVCKQLRQALKKQLKREAPKRNGEDDRDDNAEDDDKPESNGGSPARYSFYRLGDYYGVPYSAAQRSTTTQIRGSGLVYIFRVRDLSYVTQMTD